ncbi:MAG: M48 family metallopeptidase [Clostridium sp.]
MKDNSLFVSKFENEFFQKMKEKMYFEEEIREYYKNIYEKRKIPDLLGKTVEVKEFQFNFVYKIIKEICDFLQMEMVKAYVYEDFYYGVESKGIEEKWIEISAKTISDASEDELRFLIAREIYNIKFGNTEYLEMIKLIINGVKGINSNLVGISNELLKIIMYKWSRSITFSADNFACFYVGNLKVATNGILLAILNNKELIKEVKISEYIKQGDKIDALDDVVYNSTKLDEQVHYGPYRIKNLISYYSSKRYSKAKEEYKK